MATGPSATGVGLARQTRYRAQATRFQGAADTAHETTRMVRSLAPRPRASEKGWRMVPGCNGSYSFFEWSGRIPYAPLCALTPLPFEWTGASGSSRDLS